MLRGVALGGCRQRTAPTPLVPERRGSHLPVVFDVYRGLDYALKCARYRAGPKIIGGLCQDHFHAARCAAALVGPARQQGYII